MNQVEEIKLESEDKINISFITAFLETVKTTSEIYMKGERASWGQDWEMLTPLAVNVDALLLEWSPPSDDGLVALTELAQNASTLIIGNPLSRILDFEGRKAQWELATMYTSLHKMLKDVSIRTVVKFGDDSSNG